ncbi:Glycosyl Hydrolase Family 88 [Mariniphaga anaerophila]|uniref:Glycosyl Hydrolase Family 88 n=1 Tax=Mariniphaga anaerophila TaxID=1484053 RepID=A0A1M4WLS2_9BACT|nr:glycoside hydrolase family 88 protein [Mariniphaga anaerophila]SHE82209.1 Glycosyl Hydrolase Family 88 [Mariniphaga anaerophila]
MKIRTKPFRILLCLIAAGFFMPVLKAEDKQDVVPNWVRNSMEYAQVQAKKMLPEVLKTEKLPRSFERGLCEIDDWTSGFYPGVLWYLYEYSGDDFWKSNAEKVTSFLAEQQYNTGDHDVGFRIFCSYGNGWLLTGNKEYEKVIVQAARSLASRYNDKTKTIMSWNPNERRDWKFPVIIDNMMNLELIYEAYKLSGDERLKDVAISHADQTIKYQYRPNYSCPHVIDFDPETGAFRKMDWNNGFSDPEIAEWSRGQSWGLYGFTMMYRETNKEEYLKQAEKIADFLLNHPNMPEDLVPYWDYVSPKIPTMRDASAGAIMASALLELSTFSSQGEKYFKAGEKMLKSLASDEYRADPVCNGNYILRHATGNFLRGSEVDGTLIYADYYFVEGLLRYLKLTNGKPLFALK